MCGLPGGIDDMTHFHSSLAPGPDRLCSSSGMTCPVPWKTKGPVSPAAKLGQSDWDRFQILDGSIGLIWIYCPPCFWTTSLKRMIKRGPLSPAAAKMMIVTTAALMRCSQQVVGAWMGGWVGGGTVTWPRKLEEESGRATFLQCAPAHCIAVFCLACRLVGWPEANKYSQLPNHLANTHLTLARLNQKDRNYQKSVSLHPICWGEGFL